MEHASGVEEAETAPASAEAEETKEWLMDNPVLEALRAWYDQQVGEGFTEEQEAQRLALVDAVRDIKLECDDLLDALGAGSDPLPETPVDEVETSVEGSEAPIARPGRERGGQQKVRQDFDRLRSLAGG